MSVGLNAVKLEKMQISIFLMAILLAPILSAATMPTSLESDSEDDHELDVSYLTEMLFGLRQKCSDTNNFFRGSCYYVSNQDFSSSPNQVLKESILKLIQSKSTRNLEKLKSTVSAELEQKVLPEKLNWKEANHSCSQLSSKKSHMLTVEDGDEFKFVVDLLMKRNFNGTRNRGNEIKYQIGLKYNGKTFSLPLFSRRAGELTGRRKSLFEIKMETGHGMTAPA